VVLLQSENQIEKKTCRRLGSHSTATKPTVVVSSYRQTTGIAMSALRSRPAHLIMTLRYALQQSGDFLRVLIQLKQNMGRLSVSCKSRCELLTGFMIFIHANKVRETWKGRPVATYVGPGLSCSRSTWR
jgi:hypothetical protein